MMRNADYINEFIIDPNGLSAKAQVGVDLTINTVSRIGNDVAHDITQKGVVYNDATAKAIGVKATFAPYANLEPEVLTAVGKDGVSKEVRAWTLTPGVYSISMDQGLKPLSKVDTAFIIQRSTLGRNGAMIRSSVYDPGFETDAIGAVLYVHNTITIEQHARVAQIIIHENEDAELYNGSYQGAKDFS